MTTFDLAGLRVLVVEDEPMIGMLVEDILLDAGCRVSGPYLTFGSGLAAATDEAVDAAILDVNLAGTQSYPIAEVLEKRGIPFVLTSGYGDQAAPADHPEWPVCEKPFTPDALFQALGRCAGRSVSK